MQTHAVTVPSAVVVNPSKVLDPEGLRQTVSALLAGVGWPEPTWFETTREDPGRGQTRRAVAGGAQVVFVCGGDGTVRSCAGALVGTEVALAILPCGTGNLLAANLGLAHDLVAAVEIALQGGLRRIDVGMVGEEIFTVMAGMGFDAEMLAATSEVGKARIGWLAYVFGGLRHLGDRPMRVSVRIDDLPPVRRRARTVLIGNVGRLQGGLRLLVDAEPDDGAFDVAVLTPRTLGHWVSLAWAVMQGRRRVPRMEVYRGRRVQVVSNRAQPRELDGDVIAPDRLLRAELRPKSLWLCVPHQAGSPDLAEDAG